METQSSSFVIAIPVYDGVNLMDIAAPREIFSWVEEAQKDAQEAQKVRKVLIYYVADTSPICTRDGLRFLPDKTFSEVPHPDLIWVPGGSPEALKVLLDDTDSDFFKYVCRVGTEADHVTSVCDGAVLLASTGLLNGCQVTTHWAFYPCMTAFDVILVEPEYDENGLPIYPFYPRYVEDGNRVTGGGIASALDESLFLVKKIFNEDIARRVQVTTQYFPDPPPLQGTLPKRCEVKTCPIPGFIQEPGPA